MDLGDFQVIEPADTWRPGPGIVECAARLLADYLGGHRIEEPPREVERGAVLAAAAVDPDLALRLRRRILLLRLLHCNPGELEALAAETLSSFDKASCSVSALEYVAATQDLPERLALRFVDVQAGRVALGHEHLRYLVARAIQHASPTPPAVPAWVQEEFADAIKAARKAIEERRRRVAGLQSTERRSDCYPPCIQKWLQDVQSGQPLAHVARFNLTAFLNAVGYTRDEQVALYAQREDFDAAETRYQVQQITEPRPGRGTGSGYLPMACRRIRGRDACPDHQCPGPTPLLRYAHLRGDQP